MDFAPSSAPADQATPACADGRPEQSPVFVHAPNPMILVSPEAVILDINLAGHDLSGKPEMSLIGKRFGEAFDCVNASGNRVCGSSTGCQACPVRQTIAEVLLSGRPVHDLETKVTLIREGTPRRHDVLLSAVPMNQEGHNIVLICLVDITALKRAEQALRAGEEAYRLLVEHQTDLVVKVDSKGRFLFVSPSYCRTFGKTEAELLGREFMPLVHEEDRESTTRGMEALSRPPHTAYVEQRAKTAHGWRWLAWSDTAILNDWGEIEAVIGVGRDITAWKRTEESLRESEERFALAFKSSPAAQVVSDIETGRFIDVNDRWVELLGYSRQEQLGRTSKEVGIWADPTDRDRAVAGLKTKGSFKDRPIEFKTKSGLILSVLWSAETIALGGRQVMLSMIYDDTERKRAEQALRESEERYRLLSDVTMEGIVVHKNGVVVDLNVALARMTGYSREELLGQDILKRSVHEADRDIVRENMVKEYARPYVVRCLRKNGDIFHAELEGRDLEMDGQIFRAAAVRDVTARVMAERALRESEDRFANVMAAINDGIWDWDTQSGEIFFDRRYYTMAGYEPGEFPSTFEEFWKRVHPEDSAALTVHMDDHFEGRVPTFDVEFRFRKKGGEWMWIRGRGKVVRRDENGRPVRMVGTHTDITDRRRAEEERERLQAQLFQAQKMESVGILAGGVAHDFNNLLQAMGGNIQLLLQGKPPEHPDAARLRIVGQAIDRAGNLVRQLLLFGRKDEIRKTRLNLSHEVEEAVRILERTIPRMIEIRLVLEPRPWSVDADPVQIEQILFNLGINAADAMPGGGRLTIETRNVLLDESFVGSHPGAKAGEHVLMSVADTGCGMDPKTQQHVFEPFFTTKEVGKGTGLGLSSAYGIVKAHGGTILCLSEPGRGTIFKIYWPAASEVPGEEAPPKPEAPARGGTETILIVDDEADIRDLTTEALETSGYTVVQAASGEEALTIYLARDEAIDLVIMDLNMPGMGGRQCLLELIHLDSEARVLVASGYSADGPAGEILGLGAAGFIGKPYRISELLASIRDILDR